MGRIRLNDLFNDLYFLAGCGVIALGLYKARPYVQNGSTKADTGNDRQEMLFPFKHTPDALPASAPNEP